MQPEFFDRQKEALSHLSILSNKMIVLFGGAAGGSKSFLGCAWQIERRLKYPGTRGLIGRSELKNLRQTTLVTFFEVASMYGLKANRDYVYNAQMNTVTFPMNDSVIVLKDLFAYPSDPNFDSLGSLEITDFFIDEVAQVTPKAVDILKARVRYKLNEYNLRPKGLMTCNPSKGWLYNDFYKPWKDGTLPDHLAFVPALPGDNPNLPASYMEILDGLQEEDRKRLRDGDWNFDVSKDRIFQYDDILRCFRNEVLTGDFYITADVARMGKDRTVIGVWQGLTLLDITILRKQRVDEVTTFIKGLQTTHNVKLKHVIADEDGVGGGVVDNMRCIGFVNGARAKRKPEIYVNQKAECYFKLGELIEQGKIIFSGPVKTSYMNDILKELDLIRRKRPDGDIKLAVTGKEEIYSQHKISPDIADMIMMRMYFELNPNEGKYSYI